MWSEDARRQPPPRFGRQLIVKAPMVQGLLLSLVAVVACGPDEAAPITSAPTTATPATSPRPTARPMCPEEIPFGPTYLPDGFREEPHPGPFPGGRPRDEMASIGGRRGEYQVVVHYRGSGSRAIEIRRPGTLFTELAQASDPPTIDVLRFETSGFAPIEPGGGDFIVWFAYPPDYKPHEWCKSYSLNEYGVPLGELTKVAEGLRART